MANPILLHIQAWLKQQKDMTSDLEDGHLTFNVTGFNRYVNRLMLFNNGRVLSWYGYTLIDPEKVRDSQHRTALLNELMLSNDRMTLGRWAVNQEDLLLFDVSIPLGDVAPSDQVLNQVFGVMNGRFDRMISRLKLLLDTGVVLNDAGGDVPLHYLKALIARPDIYPAMHRLGLLPDSADAVLRQLIPLPELAPPTDGDDRDDHAPSLDIAPAVH